MKIVLTGGGTAGHAMVGSILTPLLVRSGWSAVYIGSASGAERKLIEKQALASYHAIPTGKLRRYFSLKNLAAPFQLMAGIIKSYGILKKEAPHVVFSGGGYVSVPVVIAAWALGIPVLLRETDYTVGLANRICLPFAAAVYVTFPDTAKQINTVPVRNDGIIVRPALLQPSASTFVFQTEKPILLVMGGSLGAAAVNQAVRKDLPLLLSRYHVIHLCGVGNTDDAYADLNGYQQLEYLEDMASAYQAAAYVLMRCGSNAVCEGLALGKRMICVPLTKSGSRGEQYDNAAFAAQNGNAVILNEAALCGQTILDAAQNLDKQPPKSNWKLTPLQLHQNCMAQIAQLRTLGLDKLHRDFMENICYDRYIDFFGLNKEELLYYNELAEAYGL